MKMKGNIMKSITIMQGCSGSGKSFIAEAINHFDSNCSIRSTDSLWYENGCYKFDYKKLKEKHLKNQYLVECDMKNEIPNIIIDNTNITQKQAQPYINLANKYDYNISVIKVSTSITECKRRNSFRYLDRMVPENVIDNQFKNMKDIIL